MIIIFVALFSFVSLYNYYYILYNLDVVIDGRVIVLFYFVVVYRDKVEGSV